MGSRKGQQYQSEARRIFDFFLGLDLGTEGLARSKVSIWPG